MIKKLCINFDNIQRIIYIKLYYCNNKLSFSYFWTSSEPMTLMKHASVRLATALAHNVLPVPGGPYSNTPFGGSKIKLLCI